MITKLLPQKKGSIIGYLIQSESVNETITHITPQKNPLITDKCIRMAKKSLSLKAF